ncbi:TPA: tRNA (adenosine(37)-N6)-threonylcarbamoyltransferase complex ATPase subunit type 1 TsaE [Candidatus Poribacteria bacterium]|nr:tRNA (adenosine(37)-N6)-threonylcarbamoyltransferase complex ATPase subunit type 1 TsaE [Candidatus Poribacteria bacterium]
MRKTHDAFSQFSQNMQLIFTTHSPTETQELGYRIGKLLKKGSIVALIGDLGAGKTCLTQGIARGIGIDANQVVNSPSYILINEYTGSCPVYHIDLYRIRDSAELDDLGLEEYIYGHGICVIEWADRLLESLPESYLKILLSHAKTEDTRTIEIINVGAEYTKLIEGLIS